MARLALLLTGLTTVIALLGGFRYLMNEWLLMKLRKRQTGKWLMVLAVCLLPSLADAATCTKGTDCYCDKVQGGSLNDTALLFCEDFEASTMRTNTGVGNGSPYYGPWYDATGQTGNRGNNSYWNKKYGNGVESFLWANGQPTSPTVGSACTFALCTGHVVWHPSNLWDGNSYTPLMAIYAQDSDFTSENGSLTVPTNTADGGNGVFDGNASLTWRIPTGATHGIAGSASFSTVTELGMTMAMAYPTNSLTSGIWGVSGNRASWKHNEWKTVNAPNCGFDGLFSFYNQEGPIEGIPFAGFIGAFGSDCLGGHYSGSIVSQDAGSASLIGGANGVYWNTPSGYSQPTDWPFGTWGCVRGHIVIGATNETLKIWFQGPNDSAERLLIDVTYTKAGLDNVGGYDAMKWNAYANTNQGGGYTATTALTFRYEDNVHVRQGVPVSCAQIGFTGGGSGGTIALFLNEAAPYLAPIATSMIWQFRASILSGMLAVWMMGGAFLSLTTQKTKQISYTAATATMHGVVKVLEKVAHKGGRHDS